MPGCDILADNKEENPLLTWEFGFLLRKNKGGKSSPHIGVRIFASQKLGGLKMHKELEVMKPRCKGLWKKCSALIAGMYFRVLSITPLIAKAADKKSDTTDTGVSDVTELMLSKIWCLAVLVVSELSFWHGACWTLAQRMRRMKQRSKVRR